jgi:hypothetical protein
MARARVAATYGTRYLLRMVVNLAIDRDDAGNAAGHRTRGHIPASMNGVAPSTKAKDATTQHEGGAAPMTLNDTDMSGRRAAVQLSRALPQHVIEPPKRRLDREL